MSDDSPGNISMSEKEAEEGGLRARVSFSFKIRFFCRHFLCFITHYPLFFILFAQLLDLYNTKKEYYGATDSSEEEGSDEATPMRSRSIHRVNPSNVWTSVRMPIGGGGFLGGTRSSQVLSDVDEFDLVPSELTDNMKLVTDAYLEPGEKGKLWFAEEAFYNKDHGPEYALTVNPDIYQRLFQEVHSARRVPCGLYFCCHGGDGAHTGLSHDDYVDIRVAWILASIIIGGVLLLNLMD